MNIDWKRKLTIRKFWVAVSGFVTAVLVALNIDKLTVGQIAAIISAAGVLVSYIVGESIVDAAHVDDTKKDE